VDSLPLNTKEEWLSVLDLSHLFGFDRYTDLAAHRLMSLTSAMDKILLGRRFGIQGWLRSAYRELCEQAGWVSDADGFRLGLSDVLRIGRVRGERSSIPTSRTFRWLMMTFCPVERISFLRTLAQHHSVHPS
jgi:hypothetical protein